MRAITNGSRPLFRCSGCGRQLLIRWRDQAGNAALLRRRVRGPGREVVFAVGPGSDCGSLATGFLAGISGLRWEVILGKGLPTHYVIDEAWPILQPVRTLPRAPMAGPPIRPRLPPDGHHHEPCNISRLLG